MTEKRIDTKLKEYIKNKKGLYIKMSPVYFIGIPDRLCLLPGGLIFFAELKRPGKEPSAIQKLVRDKLIKLGFSVYIIDSLDYSEIKELWR